MKFALNALMLLITASLAFSEEKFSLPPEIATGLANSRQSEGLGDLSVREVDEVEFLTYIERNWRKVVENIESVPQQVPPPGFRITSQKQAFNASVSNFASACECLQPLEYVEFLNGLLSLYESGRISSLPLERNFLGQGRKRHFLAVNWEHPEIKLLCIRAISVFKGKTEFTDLAALISSISKGELADNYEADDGTLPETLPGIKLRRPFSSLIPKIEALTGKKVPADPNFPESDPSRPAKTPAAIAGNTANEWTFWRWGALVGALFILSWAAFRATISRSRSRKAA